MAGGEEAVVRRLREGPSRRSGEHVCGHVAEHVRELPRQAVDPRAAERAEGAVVSRLREDGGELGGR